MNKILIRFHMLLDVGLTATAFVSAYFIKKFCLPFPYRGLTEAPNYYIVLLLVLIIWYLNFNIFELYRSYRKRTYLEILANTAVAVSVSMVVLIALMYFFKITDVSRIMMAVFFVLNLLLLVVSKSLIYHYVNKPVKEAFDFWNYLVVGCRERAKDVIDQVHARRERGYRVAGCLDTSGETIGKEVREGVFVIGTVRELEKILRNRVIDEVVFAMPLKDIEGVDDYILVAEKIGVGIRIIPDWYQYKIMFQPTSQTIRYEPLFDVPALAVTSKPFQQGRLFVKAIFDHVLAALILLALLPLFAVIALLIRLFSKGPVFFRQERVGLNGRRFTLYKFRTMVPDAEAKISGLKALNEADGPVFKIEKDPRIIPYIGTFLRKTSLDELPQLINVLKGEMSLIGPRPPIPAEIEQYEIWQRRRLSMKPGLTCLWQISPDRNKVRFEDWIRMDLDYIDNWSLWLDAKIFFKTFLAVILGRGR